MTVVALLGLLMDSAWAQSRLRFPTLLQVNDASAGASAPSTGGTTSPYGGATSGGATPAATAPAYGGAPAYGSGSPSVYGGATAPATTPSYGGAVSPTPGYGASGAPAPSSGGWAPTTSNPPSLLNPGASSPMTPLPAPSGVAPTTPSYGGTPGMPSGPTASFNGSILPPPTFDPYAAPGAQPAPTLLPTDPYLQSPNWQLPSFSTQVSTMQKFIQEVRADYTWMAPNSGGDRFGVQDLYLTSTFAFPAFYSTAHPLLVTPGFAFHWFDGPISSPPVMPNGLPPQVYDAFLDVEWNPQFNQFFGAELGARVGVFSDFKKWDSNSIRYPAHALAVLRFSPSFTVKAGAMYLDRVHYKLFPAGGVEWRPNPDNRFEIYFPNPKFAHRLGSDGVTEWWVYARGEYGGGSWSYDEVPGSKPERFDYNDIRVAVGLEFFRQKGVSGLVEVGGAFDRELYFDQAGPNVSYPKNTLFLRGGLAF